MIDTAEAAIPPQNSKPRLPRLGRGHPGFRKTKEVELEDAGASLLLRRLSVATILEIQESTNFDSENVREQFVAFVALIGRMVVEPELTEAEWRAHVDELTFADWQHLQQEALEFAGIGEETRQKAQADFRGDGREA